MKKISVIFKFTGSIDGIPVMRIRWGRELNSRPNTDQAEVEDPAKAGLDTPFYSNT